MRDFSGEQGRLGWTYGYWDRGQDVDGRYGQAEDFRRLTAFGSDASNGLATHDGFTTGALWTLATPEGGDRVYTSIWATGGHPHGEPALPQGLGKDHWAIRRWTSPSAGTVEISGDYGKTMPWGANWTGKVRVQIVVENRVVLEAEADERREPYALTLQVAEGAHVDFMLGPDSGGSMGVIDFTARIRSPEPSFSRS